MELKLLMTGLAPPIRERSFGSDGLPRDLCPELVVYLTKHAQNHPIDPKEGRLLIDLDDKLVQEAFQSVQESTSSYLAYQKRVIDSLRADLTTRSDLDEVTQLPLWAVGKKELIRTIEVESRRHGYAVLFTDVYDFKWFNEHMDHTGGDMVLQSIAEILRTNIRPDDFICRKGGDENLIILRALESVDEAVHKAVELVKAVSSHQWEFLDKKLLEHPPAIDMGLLYCEVGDEETRQQVRSQELGEETAEQFLKRVARMMKRAKWHHRRGRVVVRSCVAQIQEGGVVFFKSGDGLCAKAVT
jgi:diguanylate cyclase (GGDEF)-like protein